MNKQTFSIPTGTEKVTVEQVGNQLITTFIPKKEEFKKGDFIKSDDGAFAIVEKRESVNWFTLLYYYNRNTGNHYTDYSADAFTKAEIMTDEEKQLLLDKMHSRGYDWDAKKMEVVEYRWKPKVGETYLYANPTSSMMYSQSVWGGKIDNDRLDRGIIAKTPEEAIEKAKKMLNAIKE